MITIKLSFVAYGCVTVKTEMHKCLVGRGKEGVVNGREGIEGRLWIKGGLQNALDMIKCKGNQRL